MGDEVAMATPAANFYITAENKTFRAVNEAQRSLRSFGHTAGQVAGTVAKVGGAATAAAGGVAYLVDRTLDQAQQLENLSRQTGFSVERIQELRFSARATGVEVDTMDSAVAELSQRMGEAAADGGEMAEGFKQAGLEVDNLASRNPAAVFRDVADAIRRADSEAEASAIAVKVFGEEEGRRILPLLRQGADRMEELTARAREMGIVMSSETVAGARDAADQLDTLKGVVTTQFTAAIAQLGPDIAEFTGELAENPELIKDFASDVGTLAGNMATLASNAAEAATELADLFENGTGRQTDALKEMEKRVADQRLLVEEARSNLMSAQNPGALRSFGQNIGLTPGVDDARQRLIDEANELRTLLVARDRLVQDLDRQSQEAAKVSAGGGADGTGVSGGGGDTPKPGLQGIDIEAARKRADEFDKIWAGAVRSQKAMHQEVAKENAEAYRTLDEEWNKAVRQQQALEDQSKETADVMADAFDGWANRFSSTLTDTIFDAEQTLGDFAEKMVETFAKMGTQAAIQQGIQGLAQGIGGGGSGGTGLGQGPGGYSLEGFADGGSFTVGGGFPPINAGRDNRLVAFAARDGERVSVTPPGGGGGGSPQINQTITVQGGGDVDMAAVREAARQGAEGGYRKALDDARRGGPLRKAMQS
jgi:methyl-accepting chemotaxis protein